MWERTVQECYCARLCYRAKSQLVRKTTNKFKSWWKPFSMAADVEWTIHYNERQLSVNDLWICKYGNQTVIWLLLCITDLLAAFIGKRDSNTVPTPFWSWVPTERQQFSALHLWLFIFRMVTDIHLSDIGSLHWQRHQQPAPCRILKMSDNQVSTDLVVAYSVIKASHGSSRS